VEFARLKEPDLRLLSSCLLQICVVHLPRNPLWKLPLLNYLTAVYLTTSAAEHLINGLYPTLYRGGLPYDACLLAGTSAGGAAHLFIAPSHVIKKQVNDTARILNYEAAARLTSRFILFTSR